MEFMEEINPFTGEPEKKKKTDPLANVAENPFNFQPDPIFDSTPNPYANPQPEYQSDFGQEKIDALDPRSIEPPPETNDQTAATTDFNLWNRFTLNTAEAQASLDRFDEKISNFGKKVEELTGLKTLSEFDGDNSIMGKAFRGTLYMGNALGNSLERGAYSLASFFGAEVPRDANGLIRGQIFEEEGYGFYSLFGEVGAFMIESAAVVGVASKAARAAQYLGRSVEGIRGLQTAGKVLQAPSRIENYVQAIDKLSKAGESVGFTKRMTAKAAEYAAREATVDFFFQDPRAGRLSDLVGAWTGQQGKQNYLSWLESDETDTEAEARFKNVVEGMMLEGPFSVVMKSVESGTKMAGSALRGGLGLTDNFMNAAKTDKKVRKLVNTLSDLTDQADRDAVLRSIEDELTNPKVSMASTRAAVMGDLGDGRSPILDAENDDTATVFNKTRRIIEDAASKGENRVYFEGSGSMNAALPSDGIFVDVTNEINVDPAVIARGKASFGDDARGVPIFRNLDAPTERTVKTAYERISEIRKELDDLRGGLDSDSWLDSIGNRLQKRIDALTERNKRVDLDAPQRKAYELEISARKEQIEKLKAEREALGTKKDMSEARNIFQLQRMLEDWGVAQDMIKGVTKDINRLNREINQIKAVVNKIMRESEASTNPRTADLVTKLIEDHNRLIDLENQMFDEIRKNVVRLEGLSNSFDLADGSRGKFRKNDFFYGRRDTATGTYNYGVARGFKDITAAIYTALDSQYSNGKITIYKDGVPTEVVIRDLMRNPRKYKNLITQQQVDQIIEARFSGPLEDNILTTRNLFYEQIDAPAVVGPKPAAKAVEPTPQVTPTQAPTATAEMAEVIKTTERRAEATRKDAITQQIERLKATQELLEAQRGNRRLIKAKDAIDAENLKANLVKILGGDAEALVPIGGGRSARAKDVAEVLVETIHKKFLAPFRMTLDDGSFDADLGNTDFVEKLVTIAMKTVKDGSFARNYLHEGFHAVLGVMENSPAFREVMNDVRARYVRERARFIEMNPEFGNALTTIVKGEDIISGKAAKARIDQVKSIALEQVNAKRLTKEQAEQLVRESYRFVDYDEYLAEILTDRGLRELEYRAAMSDPKTSAWGKAIKMAVRAMDSVFQAIGQFFGRDNVEKLFTMIQRGEGRVDVTSNLPGSIRMLMGNPMDTSGSATARNLDYPKEILIDNKTARENFEAQRDALKSVRRSVDPTLKASDEALQRTAAAEENINKQNPFILNPRLASQADLDKIDIDETAMNLSQIAEPHNVLVTLRATEVAMGGREANKVHVKLSEMQSQGEAAARNIMQQEQALFNGDVERYAASMGENPNQVRARLFTQLNLTEKEINNLPAADQAMLMGQLRGSMLARRQIMIYAGKNFLNIFQKVKTEGKWNGKNFDLLTESEKKELINAFDGLAHAMNGYKLLSGEAGRTLRSLNNRVSAGDFSDVPPAVIPAPGTVIPTPATPGTPAPTPTPATPGAPTPTVTPTPSPTAPMPPGGVTPPPGGAGSTRAAAQGNVNANVTAYQVFEQVLGVEAIKNLTDSTKIQNYVLLMQSVAQQLELAGSARFGLVSMRQTGFSFPTYVASNLMTAPISLWRNTFGNAFNLTYMLTRGFAGAIGETLVGNRQRGVEAIKFWKNFLENILQTWGDAWSVAKDGWRNQRSYLTASFPEGNELTPIYTKNLVPSAGGNTVTQFMSKFAQTLGEAANKTVGLGARVSTYTDEGFKQLIYRSASKAQLRAKFEAQGLRGPDLVAKVEDAYTELFKSRNAYNVNALWDKATTNVENMIASGSAKAADFIDLQQAEFERLYQSVADTYGGGDMNTVKDFVDISRGARKLAERGTFSDQESIIGTAINRVKYSPDSPAVMRWGASLLFPFVSTPLNILEQGFKTSVDPLTAAWQYMSKNQPLTTRGAIRASIEDLKAGINSKNLAVRADATGRLHTGMALYALGVTMVFNGTITGGGPRRKEERDNWINVQGNQPYSIKIGDKWVSYQFMEPLSTFFGILADAFTASNYSDHELSDRDDQLKEIGYGVVTGIANQLTSKTFLTAMNRFMAVVGDPESRASVNFMKGVVRSTVPLSSVAENYKVMTDPVARDLHEMTVAFTPWFFDPNAKMDKRYDVLGKEITYDPMINDPQLEGALGKTVTALGRGALSVAPVKDASKSKIIAEEFDALRFAIKPPSPKLGDVDLRRVGDEPGNSAYAQWMKLTGEVKIGGMNLEQRLEQVIKSPYYKRLAAGADISDAVDSPRKDYLRAIMNMYRERAKFEMMKKNPKVFRAAIDLSILEQKAKFASTSQAIEIKNQILGVVKDTQRK